MVKQIAIAGAGSGGLMLAKELASAGMDVTVYEGLGKNDLMKKYNWSDALELSILKDVGLPIPFAKGDRWYGAGVIGEDAEYPLYQPRRVSEMGIYSPDYKLHTATDVDFRFVLTDRTELLKWMIAQAEAAGAKIRYECKVIGLLGKNIENGALGDIQVEGVVVEQGGNREEIAADLVVDATGQASRLRTMLKGAPEISEPFNANQYGYVYKTHRKCGTTEVVADNADMEHPPMRNHRRLRTENGYIFFHPHDEHQFDIGGGAPSMDQAIQNAHEVIEKIPGVTDEVVAEAREKNIKGLPPDAIVASGFMVIGHAAAQVHPTHGCGISTAYMAALLAAQVIKKAKLMDIDTLWEYAYRWMSAQGAHFVALFFRLKDLAPEEMTFLIENNIINGETLTNDYNGNYLPPNVNEMRRLEDLYPRNPGLIRKWMEAEGQSGRSFEHCRKYPPRWNALEFDSWRMMKPF